MTWLIFIPITVVLFVLGWRAGSRAEPGCRLLDEDELKEHRTRKRPDVRKMGRLRRAWTILILRDRICPTLSLLLHGPDGELPDMYSADICRLGETSAMGSWQANGSLHISLYDRRRESGRGGFSIHHKTTPWALSGLIVAALVQLHLHGDRPWAQGVASGDGGAS